MNSYLLMLNRLYWQRLLPPVITAAALNAEWDDILRRLDSPED